MIKGFFRPNAQPIARAPKNREPVSPINIFAGFRLKNRNPRDAPISAEERMATSYIVAALTKRNDAPIAKATEAASPSIPSVRLAEFTEPIRATRAIG